MVVSLFAVQRYENVPYRSNHDCFIAHDRQSTPSVSPPSLLRGSSGKQRSNYGPTTEGLRRDYGGTRESAL